MYLVKSCSSEFHPLSCGTLRIGTLDDYRETHIPEIADKFEGTFTVNVKLHNRAITKKHFQILNQSHNSFAEFIMNEVVNIDTRHEHLVYFDVFDYTVNIKNNNRFIFCWSSLTRPLDCKDIFDGYESYWYIENPHKREFLLEMAKSLFRSINLQESHGHRVFSGEYEIQKLQLGVRIQNVHYRERGISVDNLSYDINADLITECLQGASLIKPIHFSRECESRIIFDFYYNDVLLHPTINSLIIKISEPMKALIQR